MQERCLEGAPQGGTARPRHCVWSARKRRCWYPSNHHFTSSTVITYSIYTELLHKLLCLRSPKRTHSTESRAKSSIPYGARGKEMHPCSLVQLQWPGQKMGTRIQGVFFTFEFPEEEAEGPCWALAMFTLQRKEGRTVQLRHEKRQMLQAKHKLNYHL